MVPIIREVCGVTLITANADFNPLHQLKKLAAELKAYGFKGHVLFDLLAINGQAHNRFVKILFDGHKFDRTSLAIEVNVNQHIRDEQDSVFKRDKEFLKASVLSSKEVDDFLNS